MSIIENLLSLMKSRVNLRLLPIKLHFFFFYGAVGAVLPFVPLIAKELGITATAVGVIYTVLPFIIMLCKPFFGALTDYFQNVKFIIIILTVIASSSFFSIIYIPHITPEQNATFALDCEQSSTALQSFKYNLTCLNFLIKTHETACADQTINACLSFLTPDDFQNDCDNRSVNADNTVNATFDFSLSLNPNVSGNVTTKFSCKCEEFILKFTEFQACSLNGSDVEGIDLYRTSQFWAFAILAIISGTSAAGLFSLSDAACYELLGNEPQLYGKQRLWGTVSWGITTLLTGYLNDLLSVRENSISYAPGFYLMLSLIFVDLVILACITLEKANSSSSICKDISHMFTSFETIIFAIGVFIVGGLTGILWQYQFWFLRDLGAEQLLLGLTVTVQCIGAEVPCFFVAGKIIRIFGHMYCLIGTFVAFALRYIFYFLLKNPWFVLPIELLHGVTFGIFYATLTSFANSRAPSGTEATMIGLLGGLFEGLGSAVGSLLGGLGFDMISASYTFLVASCVSVVCSVLFLLIRLCANINLTQQKIQTFAQNPRNDNKDGK